MFHPDAAKCFNDKAEALIALVKPHTKSRSSRAQSFENEVHSTSIPESDVIGMKLGKLMTYFGDTSGMLFELDDEQFGITGEAYDAVDELVRNMYRNAQVQSTVSRDTLTERLHEWIEQRYAKRMTQDFTDYLISNVNIKSHEIWIPINNLQIESAITIGNVRFVSLSRQVVDTWCDQMMAVAAKQGLSEEQVQHYLNRHYRAYQGYAVAVINIKAEKSKAEELAEYYARQSIEVLRVYSKAHFQPRAFTRFDLWGSTTPQSLHLMHVNNGDVVQLQTSVVDRDPPTEVMNDQSIREYQSCGLDILSAILLKDNPTDFEKELLSASTTYAQSATRKSISDKLIYTLASLEGLFLRDQSEPITQNLAERIGFLIGEKLEERKQIIKNIRDIYRIRSAFVHHGQHSVAEDELDALQTFMTNAWQSVNAAIQSSQKFDTRRKLLDYLDDRKLS